jgi:hypothetical protein
MENVRLPGSARSERFDPSITPWTREPLERIADETCRRITLIKPVQSGGSVIGECAACYWSRFGSGMVQWNWENDEKAAGRWDSRIYPILRACRDLRWPEDRFRVKKCNIAFPTAFLRVQGVFVPDNLDSDAIRYQINEEIHNWEPGHLAKAWNRTTAFWRYWILQISNASRRGDQLHNAFIEGTQQAWEVLCPGCRTFHSMRTRWEDRKPELGGLRYDADGCRLDDGRYDYRKLSSTIHYQFPCGHRIPDDQSIRRAMSLSGRYGDPQNHGAPLSDRSYKLDAVSVDYIPWLQLIREKHAALRARKWGDPEPWRRYTTERECEFYHPDEIPLHRVLKVVDTLKKSRDGLQNRELRFFAADRQRGNARDGEVPHWWLVIRDFDADGNSLLVWEGKLLTNEDLLEVLRMHECDPRCGVVDSGYDSANMYQFCYNNDIDAIKGEDQEWFADAQGERHVYSPPGVRSVASMMTWPNKYEPEEDEETGELRLNRREPSFWLYSKQGIRHRLAWLRSSSERRWEVPGDVSDDYKAHMESETLEDYRNAKTGEKCQRWVQTADRNDLLVCEAYIGMLAEYAGLTSPPDPKKQVDTPEEPSV